MVSLAATMMIAGGTTAQTAAQTAAQEAAATEAAETAAESVCSGMPAAEAAPELLWDAANSAYIDGRFDEAAKLYEEMVSQGIVSAQLYYNLANTCFRRGETARAILYYNRALVLDPSDEDARHNLAIAESCTKDRIESIPAFFLSGFMRSLRDMLGCTAWTVISLAMLAAMLALGTIFLLSGSYGWRKGSFFGMLAAAVLFTVATAFAVWQRNALTDRSQAIVMASAASVKSSPDRSATDLFVLHEGTKVTIVGTLDNWSEIVIADGKKGWIESSQTERI